MAMMILWAFILTSIMGPGAIVLAALVWFAVCAGDAVSGHDKHEP